MKSTEVIEARVFLDQATEFGPRATLLTSEQSDETKSLLLTAANQAQLLKKLLRRQEKDRGGKN